MSFPKTMADVPPFNSGDKKWPEDYSWGYYETWRQILSPEQNVWPFEVKKVVDPVLKIKKIHPNAQIPKYQRVGDAGFDLHACLDEDIHIKPESQALVPTGLIFCIPDGYEVQIRPRSGLALKNEISIPNSPCTIDSGYRGPISTILRNNSKTKEFVVRNGQRITQGVFCYTPKVSIQEVLEFTEEENNKDRGGGFGSTKL